MFHHDNRHDRALRNVGGVYKASTIEIMYQINAAETIVHTESHVNNDIKGYQ